MSKKEKIAQFLINKKGYEPHYKGFVYLTYILTYYSEEEIMDICKTYQSVAKELKVTSMSVERNLRTLFGTKAKKTTNKREIFALFHELKEKKI